MSRETTSHPAASKALPIDFVPQNSSNSLGMFNNYHQRNKARVKQFRMLGPIFFLSETEKDDEPG